LKRFPLLVVLVLLSGCAGMPGIDLSSPVQQTPATSWTDANARYSESQHRAVLYARTCTGNHAMFLTRCETVVNELNELDMLAEEIQEDGYAALGRNDTPRLREAIRDLDDVAKVIDETIEAEAMQ
jgi:hypothetical protein